MIDPSSSLKSVTIEGSKENEKAGEYVIDLAEYREFGPEIEKIDYFQLKHSVVRRHTPLTFNELQDTVSGFSERFRALRGKNRKQKVGSVAFTVVTNRPVDGSLKDGIRSISTGKKVSTRLRQGLERATDLKGASLRSFCDLLSFVDGEGDYIVQREKLRGELNEYIAGFSREEEIDHLIALIEERALPRSDGIIRPEHILDRLGVSSSRGLFPAPPQFEQLSRTVRRAQHDDLLGRILGTSEPIIIHATGGVGKSVFARQLLESLTIPSKGLIYDCFGGGKYRNPSEPRHRPCDAFVQIANEMASWGICRTLIAPRGALPDSIFRDFLRRLEQASNSLQAVSQEALLVLFIDAADNAEIAAAEAGDQCFASALLRENLPASCRLVMFSRTERIDRLRPPSRVKKALLEPFTRSETAAHLRTAFPQALEKDCLEFHRLSDGNPRVQANAIAGNYKAVDEVLTRLGPKGTTVHQQIEAQLNSAVGDLKDKYPETIQAQVDSICKGLANLPPFVPIEVLASAAGVKEGAIRSFVSDLGRPLWCSDNAVQFRDEPTESWFRQHYSADHSTVRAYATAIESLAGKYTYVAKVLPQLLLRAGDYDRLIALALSEKFLPENNPIDERDIRVFRLQFAFKAALKIERLGDAARLALRAGEEVAGDKRQIELLRANMDLIAPLQNPHRVQELAYRQEFESAWRGSSNIYSAALLSSVDDFKGEARSYLRSAGNWLQIYLEQRNAAAKPKRSPPEAREELTDADLAEFAWTVYNLQGPEGACRFFRRWKSQELIFRLARTLVRRLIDAGRFQELDKLACLSAKDLFVILALADELLAVGRIPRKEDITNSFLALAAKKRPIAGPRSSVEANPFTPAIISLAEAALYHRFPKRKIQSVLELYTLSAADPILGGDFEEVNRRNFLRGVAARCALDGKFSLHLTDLIVKKENKKGRLGTQDQREKEFAEILAILLPWHISRARLLARDQTMNSAEVRELRSRTAETLDRRYRVHDPIPYEVACIQFEVLALNRRSGPEDVREFLTNVVNSNESKFALRHRLQALRAAYRLDHLSQLRSAFEQSCAQMVRNSTGDSPEDRAGYFISLARGVMPASREDAAAYFSEAIESVSKFGDEIAERWNALAGVAERVAERKTHVPELAYRFIRCAEIVGESTSEDYWDRNRAIQIAARLDAPGTFAGLSRWRDRGVGSFNNQLRALATEAVEQELVPAESAWCFSGFQLCNGSIQYAAACVEHAKTKTQRQRILNQAIRDIELCGADLESWKKLDAIADRHLLEKAGLVRVLANCVTEGAPGSSAPDSPIPAAWPYHKNRKISWSNVFAGINVLSADGLAAARQSFNSKGVYAGPKTFWHELVQRVPAGREVEFLGVLLDAEIDLYDIGNVLEEVHQNWCEKAGVKRHWPRFVNAIGKRFAEQIATTDWNHILKGLPHAGGDDSLQKGVFEGLAESLDLIDASTFFSFVRNIANRLPLDDAAGVLDFALSRLEKHIPDDFGDGPWAAWLTRPPGANGVLAGFLWAALASPYSSIRWQAAHSVRRLAQTKCEAEIAALVALLGTDSGGPFVSPRLPFYHFHSRLYLLIALARVAVDQPDLLKPHAPVFAQIALNGLPHILIQKASSEIALSLKRAYPISYSARVTTKLKKVGKSPFPVHKSKRASMLQKRQDANNLKYHFALDFDRYWFQPLGEIFGISADEVMASATEVCTREFKVPSNEEYVTDPRQQQWNQLDQRGPLSTYAHHGEYPRVDRYDFYYSYHSCFSVAAQLLSRKPVIRQPYMDGGEDPWYRWLKYHLLSRRDGRWLMERRDPSPIRRRHWVREKSHKNWRWSVTGDDFFDCLSGQTALAEALFVSGAWCECKDNLVEDIAIWSALVNPKTADALANALRTAEDPIGFRLPNFQDEEAEIHEPPFELLGWIREGGAESCGIDRLDPYAREIAYAPDRVDDAFTARLGLAADPERREWYTRGAVSPSLLCEVWSEKANNAREEPFRHGQRVAASCQLLKRLCALTGKHLIIEVRIRRTEDRRYDPRGEDGLGYIPASHKIFVFSHHGVLKDKDKSYRIG